MKTITKLAILTIMFFAWGCGSKSDGGSKAPKPTPEPEYHTIDLAGISKADRAMTSLEYAPVWNARLEVEGQETLNVQRSSHLEIVSAVRETRILAGGKIRLELSAWDHNTGFLLATNVREEALMSERAELWESKCSSGIQASFDFGEGMVAESDGRKYLHFNLVLCDFVGMSLTPIVNIESHRSALEKRLAVYTCEFSITNIWPTLGVMTSYDGVYCDIDYEALADQEAPSIEVPEEFAPGSDLYSGTRMQLTRFDLEEHDEAQSFRLEVEFGALPFGSHRGCYRQEIDLFYAANGDIRETRLVYERAEGVEGESVWLIQNEDQLPNFDLITSYYHDANENSRKATLYRFCEWSPSTMSAN